ncbi:hypothetical protein QUA44_04445 [Microcoleus sp. N9_A2]
MNSLLLISIYNGEAFNQLFLVSRFQIFHFFHLRFTGEKLGFYEFCFCV